MADIRTDYLKCATGISSGSLGFLPPPPATASSAAGATKVKLPRLFVADSDGQVTSFTVKHGVFQSLFTYNADSSVSSLSCVVDSGQIYLLSSPDILCLSKTGKLISTLKTNFMEPIRSFHVFEPTADVIVFTDDDLTHFKDAKPVRRESLNEKFLCSISIPAKASIILSKPFVLIGLGNQTLRLISLEDSSRHVQSIPTSSLPTCMALMPDRLFPDSAVKSYVVYAALSGRIYLISLDAHSHKELWASPKSTNTLITCIATSSELPINLLVGTASGRIVGYKYSQSSFKSVLEFDIGEQLSNLIYVPLGKHCEVVASTISGKVVGISSKEKKRKGKTEEEGQIDAPLPINSSIAIAEQSQTTANVIAKSLQALNLSTPKNNGNHIVNDAHTLRELEEKANSLEQDNAKLEKKVLQRSSKSPSRGVGASLLLSSSPAFTHTQSLVLDPTTGVYILSIETSQILDILLVDCGSGTRVLNESMVELFLTPSASQTYTMTPKNKSMILYVSPMESSPAPVTIVMVSGERAVEASLNIKPFGLFEKFCSSTPSDFPAIGAEASNLVLNSTTPELQTWLMENFELGGDSIDQSSSTTIMTFRNVFTKHRLDILGSRNQLEFRTTDVVALYHLKQQTAALVKTGDTMSMDIKSESVSGAIRRVCDKLRDLKVEKRDYVLADTFPDLKTLIKAVSNGPKTTLTAPPRSHARLDFETGRWMDYLVDLLRSYQIFRTGVEQFQKEEILQVMKSDMADLWVDERDPTSRLSSRLETLIQRMIE